MHPLIDEISNALEAATRGISAEELHFIPKPGKWCAGEILEHLMLAYTATTLGMTRALESGIPDSTASSWKQKCFRTLLLGVGYFPPGRKAPKFVMPTGKDCDYALESVKQSLPAMDLAIAACAERFGPHTRFLMHPRLGSLSAAQWRRFHQVHTLHHLKQVRDCRALAAEAAKRTTQSA